MSEWVGEISWNGWKRVSVLGGMFSSISRFPCNDDSHFCSRCLWHQKTSLEVRMMVMMMMLLEQKEKVRRVLCSYAQIALQVNVR